MNNLKNISPEKRKMFLFAPIAIIIGALAIYFIMGTGDAMADTSTVKKGEQLELPAANTKNLSSDKSEVSKTYKRALEKNEAASDDFFTVYDEKNQKGKKDSGAIYSRSGEGDEFVQKVKEQLKEIENNQTNNNSNGTNVSNNNNNTSSYSSTNTEKKEVDPFENMDSFFEKEVPNEKISTTSNDKPSDAFIYAVVDGDQVLKQNGRCVIRLSKDALIQGKVYQKHSMLYANVSFSVNRIKLNISNINHIKLNINAYDAEDGNLGLYSEVENLSAEVFNEAVEESVNEIDIKGIPVGNTIKNIFKKKHKEPKVDILNNTKLILKVQ